MNDSDRSTVKNNKFIISTKARINGLLNEINEKVHTRIVEK